MRMELQRSQSEGNISDNNNNDFFQEFSFLKNSSISEDDINSAIKKGEYRKLIEDHNATFIESKKNSSSPLHVVVICNNKHANEVKETISAVLQSGIDINHLDEQGNTPLQHLLYKAKKNKPKYLKERIQCLIERGASLYEDEELYKIIPQKEIDNIYKAKKTLQEEAKEKLSKYVQNDIEEVSIYGNCAKIKLSTDKEEFKISEFLQSDFCKNNGISGFSTLHSNGKSGMHGVVSSEGVRHYVVTDDSYEMKLNWSGNQKIKIHISANGTIKVDDKYLEQYQAGKIDVAANKDVKIGNLSLAEALEKGRWKENEVQHEMSETIRSGDRSIGRDVEEPVTLANNAIITPKKEFQPVATSTPISKEQQRAESQHVTSTPLSYADQQQPVVQRQSESQQQQANNQPSTHEDPPIIENVINTHIPEVESQSVTANTPIIGVHDATLNSLGNVSPIHNDTPDGTPESPERNGRSKPTPPIRRSSLLPRDNSVQREESHYVTQSSVPIITVADSSHTDPKQLKEDSKLAGQSHNRQEESVLSNQQQTAVKSQVAINDWDDTPIKNGSEFAEEKRAEVDSTKAKILTPKISLQELVQADDHPQNGSSQSVTSRFSSHNVVDDPTLSPRALKKREQRKTAQKEENLKDKVYNLRSLFTDQHVKSESAEHTPDYQPHSTNRLLAEHVYDEKFLREVKMSITEYSDVFEERKQALTTKLPPEIELCKRSNVEKEEVGSLTTPKSMSSNTLSDSENDSGYSTPTTNHDQSRTHPKQLHVGQSDLTPFEELKKRLSQTTLGLNPANLNDIGNDRAENEPELLKKFNQEEKYGLKPVDSSSMSAQTRKRLLEDELLKDTHTDAKTVDTSTSNEHSSDPKQSTNELRTHNVQGSEEKIPTYSKNFNQGSLNFNREYYNTSSLFDENEQKTAKLNNTQSSRAEQVMNELKEALKKPGKGLKESTQNAEKNIPLVNSHNPFLEQISKDIEGGKLKKGTLKNWVERVQQQESNKGRSV